MQVIAISVSPPKRIDYRGDTFETGIFKQPIHGRVMIRTLNLDGDGQADLTVHGGVDKAVYAYPHEHYATWTAELGREAFPFGQFGENLTVSGLLEDHVCVGDVYQVGAAILQVTQPRVPCYKLNARMDLPQFGKIFLKSLRTGFYLRVLEEGEVGAGDAIHLIQADPVRLSIRAMTALYYFDQANVEAIRQAITIEAMNAGWRDGFRELLAKADKG